MEERRQRRWRLGWAAVVLALSVAVVGVVPSLADPNDPGRPLLPDLDQGVPSRLTVSSPGTGADNHPLWDLSFDSQVDNVGEGPLIIKGSRASAADTMTATQFVDTEGSNDQVTYPDAGSLHYVTSTDHQHWHLDAFDRYELHRVGDDAVARPDRKTGFCIGDRYNTDRLTTLPAEPKAAVYTGYCEAGHEQALSVEEGMSVGYGDNYQARLEGQSIDITGVPAGRYLLVHRANADGKLHELRTDNDAASVLISLEWPGGQDAKPSLTVLARCPDTATCSAPPPSESGSGSVSAATTPSFASATRPGLPTMTGGVARYFVRQSLERRFGARIRGLRASCERRTRISYSCRVRFTRAPYAYRGRVWVGHWLDGTRVTYRRHVDVTGRRAKCRREAKRCARRVQVGP